MEPLPAAQEFAEVIVTVASRDVDRPFTYAIPPELVGRVQVGSFVTVPFGPRVIKGYVVGLLERCPEDVPRAAVRPLRAVHAADEFWPPGLLALASWMQAYYGCVLVEAIQAMLPEPVRTALENPRRHRVLERALRLARKRPVPEAFFASLEGDAAQARRVVAALEEHGHLTPADLLTRCAASPDLLQRLVEAGHVRRCRVAPADLPQSKDPLRVVGPSPFGSLEIPPLSADQQQAVERIVSLVDAGRPAVVLLHGVTGSGKTEVYLHALQHVLERQQQGIVLVPEIALTPQAVHRYRARLGDQVAVLHSALTPSERLEQWWRLRRGEVGVALGARSCVFAPLQRHALTIVDEEHDGSYKQEQAPRYHARQVAIRRAMETGGVVVLGSATPCLESYYWASQGRYHLVELPGRIGGRPMPTVEVVDLRRFSREQGRALSPVLRSRIRETLERGEQVMLLLNRRGFSSYLLCADCGFVERCPRCDVSLTYHAHPRAVLCHYCLYEREPPSSCAGCGGDGVRFFGNGTQRLEEELEEAFPGVPVARMDRDTTRAPGEHRRILEAFGRGETRILLGTQMIAKGHDFPGVTLVGVVLADTALNLPDFRAAERAFSLIVQVAGRAGRGSSPGHVVVQTYNPDNPSIRQAVTQDFQAFFAAELVQRQALLYPPFSHLVNVVVAGEDAFAVRQAAERMAHELGSELKQRALQILGPAPCPIPRILRKHRWHLTFKALRVQEILPAIRNYLRARQAAGLSATLDVDPLSML